MNTATARRVQRAFSRAATSYDTAAVIQRQVVAELLSMLLATLPVEAHDTLPAEQPTKGVPATVLDLGCGTGFAFAGLRARYPGARLLGLDFAESMLHRAPAAPNVQKICGNATLLPLADASVDLLVCSLTYQWCALDRALAEAQRVLRPGGWLAFSTLTGDTFRELRHAFAGLDDAPHVLPLLEPQAIGAAVDAAGLAAGSTRRETRVARFADARALFASIRQTGASEVAPQDGKTGRRRGMLGKAAYATVASRLTGLAAADGQLPLTYDVLYVTARKLKTAAGAAT